MLDVIIGLRGLSSMICLFLFQVSVDELKVFLGILLLSGYVPLPSYRMYWQSSPDTHNPLVAGAMTRDRFEAIKNNIHFAHDPTDNDRFWKLRPLMRHLQERFMENFVARRNVSHDESMIKYFGRHGLKQAIRNKPIRFGFKSWCQNTPDGYLFSFDFYQGESIAENAAAHVKVCGRSGATVLDLLDNMRPDLKELPFHFYVDNYFTSMELLKEMICRGYDITGTIRVNRIPGAPPLTGMDAFKKKHRGCMEVVKSHDIILTRWKDNSAVTLASTGYGDEPVRPVRRYSRTERKNVSVSRPHVVAKYNESMGGTDRMDQHINHARVSVGGKKWWWSPFTWMLDVSAQNAWRLHIGAGGKQTQIAFRREIAVPILTNAASKRKAREPYRRVGTPAADELRFDNIGHLVAKAAENRRGTCRCCHISRVSYVCVKCEVFLCIECFIQYHTR